VASIVISPSCAQVPAGTTFQFTATAFDAAGQPLPFTAFTWSASAGATVDSTGLVTGGGTGDATITAAAGNSANATATAKSTLPGDALTITQISAVASHDGQAQAGVTFSDGDPAGTLSQYGGTIAWGDGTSSAASFSTNPSGGFAAAGVHTYACGCPGRYTVKVTINDLGCAAAAATTTLIVPSG
jgi:hypothetical protein